MEGEEKALLPHTSITFPVRGWGLTFGNSARTNGIRFNFVDDHVEEVNGLNFTFWKPKENPDFKMHGISFALVGARYEEAWGINLAGGGINGSNITGINLAGFGMNGSNFKGINLAGISIGLKLKKLTGLGVDDDKITGFTYGTLGIGSKEIKGVGLSVGGIWCNEFKGLGVGSIQRAKKKMSGLSIGLLNMTKRLYGVQIGLINYVEDNPPLRRILPFFNFGH